jgi:hypothetical protein
MYASVYATFGVLAPSLRDANHFVFIAIVPLVIPLIFNQTFGTAPDGVLATTLSLVPFTSPIAMIARLGAASVPWWQSLAGLVALGLFAYGFVLMAARLFRAENILSSRALTWARLRSELAPASAGSKTGSPPRAVRAHEGDDISTTGSGRGGWGGRRPGSGTGGQRPAGSTQRLYLSVGVAVVLVIVGVFTYVRGDKAGIAVAIAGVVVGLITYSRLRKS